MEKVKRASAMGWKGILVSIVLNSVFALIALISILGYFDGIEIQKAIDGGKIVEAEIVGADRGGSTALRLWFKYTDENGILYEGTIVHGGTHEEAEKLFGNKVEIYIGNVGSNGKGVCWIVGKEFNPNDDLIVASIFIFLMIVYMILLIIYLLWYNDKLPKRKTKQ